MTPILTKIPIKIGDYEHTYVLAITDAHKDYDYQGITVKEFGHPVEVGGLRTKGNARLVLLREDLLEVQKARYASGLHVCLTEGLADSFPVWAVVEELLKRLKAFK